MKIKHIIGVIYLITYVFTFIKMINAEVNTLLFENLLAINILMSIPILIVIGVFIFDNWNRRIF